MGKILHIAVANKIATYCQRDGAIVCGNSDYSIKFAFDAEWDAISVKTARFMYNGIAVDVPFEGDTVAVPKLRNTLLVTVGVYGGDLQTTTPAIIPCLKSILCEDGLPPDPEPDVYARIMERLGGLPDSIDMRAFATEGKIVETYADGIKRVTMMEFDGAGNPIKITDADGNVTTLVWGAVSYTITYNAPNCTIDPMPETVDEGGRLELLAWSNEGYNLDTIQVTMGGVDISDKAVAQQGNDAQLRIESVTGDVVITITTIGG